ncbi:MAG: dockerin type I domain-containing protein [Pirellulaceae bacterium]
MFQNLFRRRNPVRSRQRVRRIQCQPLELRQLMAADVDVFSPVIASSNMEPAQVEVASVLSHGDTSIQQRTAARNGLPLSATFSAENIREDSRGAVSLTLRRNPRDVGTDLLVRVTGGDASQLPLQSLIVIPAGKSEVVVRLTPTNDSIAERPKSLTYTFTAANHQAVAASINLLDDETPTHQNPASKFDVNNDGQTTPLDILVIINALASDGNSEFDPNQNSDAFFKDVNGDYLLTPLDVLLVINELAEKAEGRSSNLAFLSANESHDAAITSYADAIETRREQIAGRRL